MRVENSGEAQIMKTQVLTISYVIESKYNSRTLVAVASMPEGQRQSFGEEDSEIANALLNSCKVSAMRLCSESRGNWSLG